MNTQASTFVSDVDLAFYVILGISLFFLIGITIFMIWVVIRYNKKRNPTPTDVKDNMNLEVAWTVIPTLLVLVMFYYGWMGYTPMRKVPNGAIEVKATGRMWAWDFEYANGKTSNVLVVPVGKPVKLNLFSPDVLHSLYIPAFRVKEDVAPGVKNYMWFQSDKLGEYDIFCAEYCGVRHSYMLSKVRVVSEEAYLQWVADVQKVEETATSIGLQVLQKNGCFACHSSDGSKLVGPSFKGMAGERTVLIDGDEKQQDADDEYIKRAIYDPNFEVVKGFNKGLMISYKDKITDAEMQEVIKYLKQLNEK
ncbi:MAG TPA: cytochrome c oxidase subunit II [Bacteroidales bacterium]|nr:cytochrome c oxidase subunit II [Bacteroidales bacterium]